MRIRVKWFMTGNVTEFDEDDSLLNPRTTIWEVKGFIKVRFNFDPKFIVLICNKQVRENDETLASLGIVDQATASAIDILAHVFSQQELDEDDQASEDPADSRIHEFSHEDFSKACRMLGRSEPVSAARVQEMREAGAPRARPKFLDKADGAPPPATSAVRPAQASFGPPDPTAAAAPAAPIDGSLLTVAEILHKVMHGLRTETAERDFAVTYPGVPEPYNYWDLRSPENRSYAAFAQPGEVAVEMFFFGEFKPLDDAKFRAVVTAMLERKGFRCRTPAPIREAGCMYPLVAVPIVLVETEARHICEAVFENFGRCAPSSVARDDSNPAEGGGKPPGECLVQ